MVNITTLPIEIGGDDFLTFEEFKAIKKRFASVPNAKYYFENENIIASPNQDGGGFVLCKVLYLGAERFLVNARNDVEKLIKHVEKAEIENDKLLKENLDLKKEIENLKGGK